MNGSRPHGILAAMLPVGPQPLLPFAQPQRSRVHWQEFLSTRLASAVEVEYGRSRSQPVRAQIERPTDGRPARWSIRLHAVFAAAPDDVALALADWLLKGRRAVRASTRLDEWIEAQLATLPMPARRRRRLRTDGAHHDLAPIAGDLFEREFADAFAGARGRPLLGWGRRRRSSARSSLQLGSYDPNQHLVKVHPVLDRKDVPTWYLRFLLFHELLHAVVPPEVDRAGRARPHGPAFRARERAYPDYERAQKLEAALMPRLLRAARRG